METLEELIRCREKMLKFAKEVHSEFIGVMSDFFGLMETPPEAKIFLCCNTDSHTLVYNRKSNSTPDYEITLSITHARPSAQEELNILKDSKTLIKRLRCHCAHETGHYLDFVRIFREGDFALLREKDDRMFRHFVADLGALMYMDLTGHQKEYLEGHDGHEETELGIIGAYLAMTSGKISLCNLAGMNGKDGMKVIAEFLPENFARGISSRYPDPYAPEEVI